MKRAANEMLRISATTTATTTTTKTTNHSAYAKYKENKETEGARVKKTRCRTKSFGTSTRKGAFN